MKYVQSPLNLWHMFELLSTTANLSRLALALEPPTDQTNRATIIVWTKAEMLTLRSDPPHPYAASALDLKGLSQSRACQWASPASFVLIQRHPILLFFFFFSFSSQEWPQQMWPDSWWKKLPKFLPPRKKSPKKIFQIKNFLKVNTSASELK